MVKPDPLLFAHACRTLGGAPPHAAMVGDRYDRDIARRARGRAVHRLARTCGRGLLPAGAAPPDATCRDDRRGRAHTSGSNGCLGNSSCPLDSIVIKGAREHNLKNVDLVLPRNRLIVVTGLSGSGKSSLAFDTIYAEGQRRYVESLSSYARQFLGQMEKPDVDYIEGLSPAISIDQKSTSRNPRSTVGTVTEVYDYLRLLYARVGTPHCYQCGRAISSQSSEQIVEAIADLPEGTRITLLAPLVRGRKGEYAKLFEEAAKEGFTRVRVDGEIRELREKIVLDKKRKHTIEVVVDRLVDQAGNAQASRRFRRDDAAALDRHRHGARTERHRGTRGRPRADVQRGLRLRLLRAFVRRARPRLFSFNSPYGACPSCSGLGEKIEIDPLEGRAGPEQVHLRRRDRAVEPQLGRRTLPLDESILHAAARAGAARAPVKLTTPVEQLSDAC